MGIGSWGLARAGAFIVLVAVVAAVVGPWVVPFDPAAQQLSLRLEGPSAAHWFGLDELGRDIFARVLAGARISLLVGLVIVGVSSTVGIALGSVAGYAGGRVDEAISRMIDILLAFPGLLLAIALVAVLGPSLTNVVLALSLIGWVGYARLVRGQVLRAREFEFVQAARALGATTSRILVRHIIPSTLPAVTVQATLGMGGAILAEAALSFLGLGVQPPTPSWGTMLSYGRGHLLDAPHLTIFPGLAIAMLVLGFNFLGDGLRDRLDPTTEGRRA
ncbi:MAG: peptide ABC transporter permease [Acidobacteria bacterium RIFCSPLOWO2_02_FULL_68_18]|nr:MAG: peptide ABC transporter permease [Acidobacteria bacterium RIFCSPLOWO2_02_FULL_68_18]OFW50246.1 MAG: peptide ABC transporter permease [Acidobacteria bacterium RIFCSPLOWO2_12_FULL_68_19]